MAKHWRNANADQPRAMHEVNEMIAKKIHNAVLRSVEE